MLKWLIFIKINKLTLNSESRWRPQPNGDFHIWEQQWSPFQKDWHSLSSSWASRMVFEFEDGYYFLRRGLCRIEQKKCELSACNFVTFFHFETTWGRSQWWCHSVLFYLWGIHSPLISHQCDQMAADSKLDCPAKYHEKVFLNLMKFRNTVGTTLLYLTKQNVKI